MVNKKGIIKILEATIAILIIFAVLLSITTTRKSATEKDLSEMIGPLLDEIAKNNTMREEIISSSNANQTITTFLQSKIRQPNIDYAASICEIDDICGMSSYPADIEGNIYAGSRIISSGLLAGARPKKVSIFLWIKG